MILDVAKWSYPSLPVLKGSSVLLVLRGYLFESMSQAAAKVCLEDLDIKPYMITKLKMAGIESVSDLAISIPHQLVDIQGGMLTGTDEHVALELVTKAEQR